MFSEIRRQQLNSHRTTLLLNLLHDLSQPNSTLYYADLREKILGLEIPKANQIYRLQIDSLMSDLEISHPVPSVDWGIIAANLFHLERTNFHKTTHHKISPGIKVLEMIVAKRRILKFPPFEFSFEELRDLRRRYRLSRSDKLIRYIISFITGINTGSSWFGLLIAIITGVGGLIFALVSSVILSAVIADFYLTSYKDEDNELLTELNDNEKDINLYAQKEGMLRLRCYPLILSKMDYIKKFPPNSLVVFKDRKRLATLIKLTDKDSLINELDLFINKKISLHIPLLAPDLARNNSIVTPKNNIYVRAVHSQYWGPLLNFFNGSGTIFGVVKIILDIIGVTVLAGSAFALYAVVAAAAIVVCSFFAYQHYKFNTKYNTKKSQLEEFRDEQIDGLKIKVEQLKDFKYELTTELNYLQVSVEQKQHERNAAGQRCSSASVATQGIFSSSNTLAVPVVPDVSEGLSRSYSAVC